MIAILISSMILGAMLANAFNLIQGFQVFHIMEVFIWIIGVILLRRSGKEFAIEMGLSVVIAFVYQLIIPYWG